MRHVLGSMFLLAALPPLALAQVPMTGGPLITSSSPGFDDRSAPSTYQYDEPPYIGWFSSSSTLEIVGANAFDAVGGSDLLTSVSCVWRGVPNGSTQRIFIWQDDGSNNIANARLLLELPVTVANTNTTIVNTYPLATPVAVSGRFYVGFSSVSDGSNSVTAFQGTPSPAFPDRAIVGAATPPFVAATPGAPIALSFRTTASLGTPGYFAIRASGSGSTFAYQGRLANAGQNYTGNADFIFTVYDRQSGGAVVGVPVAIARVPVNAGVFTVQIPADPSWFVNQPDRYLDVQVRTPADGTTYTTITPRQRIGQVPAAMVATVAQSALTVPWSGVTNVPPGVNSWAPAAEGISYSAGNVGIGTAAPIARLQVVDGPDFNHATVESSRNSGTWFNLVNTTPNGRRWSLISSGAGNPEGAGALLIRDQNAGGVRAAFLPNGNVGIGTTAPTAPLHVVGTNAFPHLRIGAAPEAPFGAFLSLDATATVGGNEWVMYSTGGSAGEGPGRLIFRNLTTTAFGTTFTSNGNVGVNTISPEQRLSVNGTAQIITNAAAPNLLAFGTVTTAENTDLIAFQRVNINTTTANSSELRLILGDDPASGVSNADFFTIGTVPGGTWTPIFGFRTDGLASKPGGGSWANISDPRTKHDVAPLKGTLDRLLSLRGYQFLYNDAEIANGRALPGLQIGLMADEVERVFPDWVSRDKDGMRMVTERSTTALMVEALRDLRAEKDEQIRRRDEQIENQGREIEDLKARLDRLEKALEKAAERR